MGSASSDDQMLVIFPKVDDRGFGRSNDLK